MKKSQACNNAARPSLNRVCLWIGCLLLHSLTLHKAVSTWISPRDKQDQSRAKPIINYTKRFKKNRLCFLVTMSCIQLLMPPRGKSYLAWIGYWHCLCSFTYISRSNQRTNLKVVLGSFKLLFGFTALTLLDRQGPVQTWARVLQFELFCSHQCSSLLYIINTYR